MWTETVESAPGTVTQVRGTRPGADPLRQDHRHRGDPRRPRHQGRADRRAARGRAHGRRGRLLRGRHRPSFPHPARGEEPLRPDRRDRRLRDDRPRPARGAEPVRAVPRRPRPRRRPAPPSSPAWRARARCSSRSRRSSRRPRSARRAAPSSAGTRTGSPWCWPCSRPMAACGSACTTSTSTSPAACASPSRRRTSPPRPRSSPPCPARRCRPTRSISARSASRARSGPVAQAPARLKEAAKLGFAQRRRARTPAARDGRAAAPGAASIGHIADLVAGDRRRASARRRPRAAAPRRVTRRRLRGAIQRATRLRAAPLIHPVDASQAASPCPFSVLDLVVIGVVVISALLAAVRGFTREVLAIVAWVAAAAAAWFLHPPAAALSPSSTSPTTRSRSSRRSAASSS